MVTLVNTHIICPLFSDERNHTKSAYAIIDNKHCVLPGTTYQVNFYVMFSPYDIVSVFCFFTLNSG